MSHLLFYLIIICILAMFLAQDKKKPVQVENKVDRYRAKPLYSEIGKAYTVYNSNYTAYDIMPEEEILSSDITHHEVKRMTEGEMLYKDYQDFSHTVPKKSPKDS
jgi:hypothetical protein